MAKREKITPPPITDTLLWVAGNTYLNAILPEEAHRLSWGQAAFRTKVLEIQNAARKLSEKLQALNEQQKFNLSGYISLECIAKEKINRIMDIDACADFLTMMADSFDYIEDRLIRPDKKGGPIEKTGHRVFIRILLAWWWKETGKRPTYTLHDKSKKDGVESVLIKWVKDCIKAMQNLAKEEPNELIASTFEDLRHLNIHHQVRETVAEINANPEQWYGNFVKPQR